MTDPASNRKAVAIAVMVATPLCFATNVVLGRGVVGDVSPVTLAFLRWSAVAIVLLPFLVREARQVAETLRRHYGLIFLLALLGMVFSGAGVYIALRTTTATNGTLIYSTSPVMIILLEAAFGGRKIRWREGLGSAIAFLGVAAIILRGEASALLTLDVGIGDLIFVFAALSWAIYSLIYRAPALSGLSNLGLFSCLALIGAVVLMPFSLIELSLGGSLPKDGAAWASVAGIVVFASLLAFSGFQFGVRTLGPSLAGIFMYLLPAYGAVLAVLVLGERFQAYHFWGIVLIMGGVVLATFPSRAKQPPVVAP